MIDVSVISIYFLRKRFQLLPVFFAKFFDNFSTHGDLPKFRGDPNKLTHYPRK